jgi:hypothetical protein
MTLIQYAERHFNAIQIITLPILVLLAALVWAA